MHPYSSLAVTPFVESPWSGGAGQLQRKRGFAGVGRRSARDRALRGGGHATQGWQGTDRGTCWRSSPPAFVGYN